MKKFGRNTWASMMVLLFGLVLFYVGTDGFHAFTAEAARVERLKEEKPKFPEVTLEDSEGRAYPVSEFKGKYVFITFLYTSCGTVCPELEMNMGEVYKQLPERFIGKDIVFLSISFDAERDTPERLDKYKNMFESDGETWRMARIEDEAELDSLLKEFGVIVIPDGEGNFAHNSAFYLVDRNGNLADVMDYKQPGEAARKVTSILEEGEQR
ncbi:SCO family protein [Neobacillus notoginsengisoli]|uniref:SCO family protein n=1 Tax=Neobacillus notoginsengisoli TaxID=1578198 RepID=A0A417YZ61_9BACI|nr:SCO family protein [Neobacillus notoginsengisoli]RHW42883.1 SCO family protein [Neobacillus notoginsengisoli]